MRSPTRKSVFLFALLAWSQCTDIIEFKTDLIYGNLIVNGRITNDPISNVLVLGFTASGDAPQRPVIGATAILHEESGVTHYYQETGNGVYTMAYNGFVAQPGASYILEVNLPNGSTYLSESEKMPEDPGIDSIYFEIETTPVSRNNTIIEDKRINIFVDTRLNSIGQANFLKWDVDEVYKFRETDFPDIFNAIPLPCFIRKMPLNPRITLINATGFTSNFIGKQFVATQTIDYAFEEQHYFNVYRYGLTEKAFEYWRKVNQVANETGSLFDVPMAKFFGNIYNKANPDQKAFGYFEASHIKISRMPIFPGQIGYEQQPRCRLESTTDFSHYPPECLSCQNIANSSLTQPDWFKP